MSVSKVTRDPATYRSMLEPHASAAEADQALNDFVEDVRAARAKYKLPNVLIVADVNYMNDGEETSGRVCVNIGDSHHGYPLAAFAYGYEKAKAAEFIAETERLAALTRKAPKR
jgi:hypothetical protein